MLLDLSPSNENAFGVALLAGRVVGTVAGSTGHITVRATCKAKSDAGRWNTVPFAKATHVFFDVPSAEGDFADKIGTFYPQGSGGKWEGHFFEDRAADPLRVKAARYLIDTISGRNNGTHVLKSERCARCSKELTHPDSIFAMFGPECIKKVGEFMPNRSGTDAGAHAPKTKPSDEQKAARDMDRAEFVTTNANDDAAENVLRDLSDAELDAVIEKSVERAERTPDAGNRRRRDAAVFERTRRNAERDERDGTAPRSGEFEPPQPSAKLGESPIVAVLRAGDDVKKILAEIDAR